MKARVERLQIESRSRTYGEARTMLEWEKTVTVGRLRDFIKNLDDDVPVEIVIKRIGNWQYYAVDCVEVISESKV